MFTFTCVRDVAAHLFLNKPVFIDEDIKEFIESLVALPYPLTNGKEATVYGTMCIAILFSQASQLWSFVAKAINHKIIKDVQKETVAEFQQDFQRRISPLVGIGKPIRPDEHLFINKCDVVYFIDEVKKVLTKLIFDFEKLSSKDRRPSSKVPTIKALLNRFDCLKDKPELITRISDLRNCWLHGYRLFDRVKTEKGEFDFDFDYLFQILFDIKSVFSNQPNYKDIIDDISECGSHMIDFYTLRIIELSYKIIDSDLFDEEKIRERMSKSVAAYARCTTPDPWFYENAKSLMNSNKKTWYFISKKFKDLKEREYEAERVEIYEFSSGDGFDIGNKHIDVSEMVLVNVNCPIEDQLTINGKYLRDYRNSLIDTYGFFDIYNVEL